MPSAQVAMFHSVQRFRRLRYVSDVELVVFIRLIASSVMNCRAISWRHILISTPFIHS